MSPFDVVVIGAGAAGLMCAIEAGKRGRRVLIVEHSDRVGKKILISGGGRCNFTNLYTAPENFISNNPHFCKSALARYTQADFVHWVERHGIAYHEKELGQLFCDQSAKSIVNMLTDECRQARVRITTDCKVAGVERAVSGFILKTSRGSVQTSSLVVATGGLSVPKIGATAYGYELAKKLGLRIVPTRAGLVPFVFGPDDMVRYRDLSGVSLPVEVHYGRQQFSNAMLFTHRGLSGPAVLQISSYWRQGHELAVNLLPLTDASAWLRKRQAARPDAELKTVLGEFLTKRLAQRLCETELGSRPLRRYQPNELRTVCERLQQWKFFPSDTEGYRTAEVTVGGVDTDDLSSTTMESKLVPRLFFIGEVVDVTGQLGGFNFQWAWSSGWAAGQAA